MIGISAPYFIRLNMTAKTAKTKTRSINGTNCGQLLACVPFASSQPGNVVPPADATITANIITTLPSF
jgi:hypothetical protein